MSYTSNEYAHAVMALLQTIIDNDRQRVLLRPTYADQVKGAIKSINRRIEDGQFADYADICDQRGDSEQRVGTDPAIAALLTVLNSHLDVNEPVPFGIV